LLSQQLPLQESEKTMNNHSEANGPHQAIVCSSDQERFAAELFDQLWQRYRQRVSYVAAYEEVIRRAGARFVNDHIAFRTFASCAPRIGIATLSRIFEALGYRPAGCYDFPDKHLNAIHYQHPNQEFPKLFISELKVWELDERERHVIARLLKSHREPLDDELMASLAAVDRTQTNRWAELQETVLREFHELSWQLPDREAVAAINQASQYAAWVMVHGYNVNHFTSLVNSHRVDSLRDIEKTIQALRDAGIPMKDQIEGEPGSKLRQSATQAVTIEVDVMDNGGKSRIPWSYAYFELAERGETINPESGQPERFEGFLGPQATNLFEMTRRTTLAG
jgi:hypothetical protein